MALALGPRSGLQRPLLVASRATRSVARPVVCQAQKEQQGVVSALALPVATLVATAMLTGAALPNEALAASSSGRVGGSSGFKARKVQQSSVQSSRTTVVNNTVVMAPPVMAPPLFGGFGFGGFSIFPVVPVPFFGGIFQLFFLLFAVSAVAAIVRGLLSSGSKNNNKKDDSWGDL